MSPAQSSGLPLLHQTWPNGLRIVVNLWCKSIHMYVYIYMYIFIHYIIIIYDICYIHMWYVYQRSIIWKLRICTHDCIYIYSTIYVYIYIYYTCIVLCTHTVQVYNLHIVYAWSTKWPHDFWRCELHRILRRTWSKRKAEKKQQIYVWCRTFMYVPIYIYMCVSIYIYTYIYHLYIQYM